MRVSIVRHGETEQNRIGVVQGRLENPLNAKGLEQSRLLAGALAELPLTHIFCSPQRRARQTCDEIRAWHRLPTPPCVIDDNIQEIYRGSLLGLPKKELKAYARTCGVSFETFAVTFGQEPQGEVLKRIARFWENRISPLRRTDANVLLVTHGAIIAGILRYLRSQNYRINDSIKRSQIDWDKTPMHSSITEVAVDFDGLGEIITVGATGHLLGFEEFAYHSS